MTMINANENGSMTPETKAEIEELARKEFSKQVSGLDRYREMKCFIAGATHYAEKLEQCYETIAKLHHNGRMVLDERDALKERCEGLKKENALLIKRDCLAEAYADLCKRSKPREREIADLSDKLAESERVRGVYKEALDGTAKLVLASPVPRFVPGSDADRMDRIVREVVRECLAALAAGVL